MAKITVRKRFAWPAFFSARSKRFNSSSGKRGSTSIATSRADWSPQYDG
jgi:hypothetical protein